MHQWIETQHKLDRRELRTLTMVVTKEVLVWLCPNIAGEAFAEKLQILTRLVLSSTNLHPSLPKKCLHNNGHLPCCLVSLWCVRGFYSKAHLLIFWCSNRRSVCVQPGEDGVAAVTPPADIRITNIALSDQIADESGRTTVKLNYIIPSADDSEEEDEEDEEDDEDEKPPRMMTTVLCSLTPGKVCSIYVPISFSSNHQYTFAGCVRRLNRRLWMLS